MAQGTIRLLALVVIIVASFGVGSPSLAEPAGATVKPEELDQLVAPIALYPDKLLSEVLMASTYPLEVVQAERWVSANKTLTGDALKSAVDKQPWDDSVKSLLATPSILEMMSSKIDWTQKLGTAVIDQQADVMDAVQRLRARAQANNKLESTKQQTVTVKQEGGRQVIAIEPTDPDTVYVPYYNPTVVYGTWPYPAYPPYYWPPPGYIAAGIIATGIAFGAGYAIGRWASGGYWGGNVNWSNNNITINRPGGGNNIGNNWNRGAHVEHRLGNRGGRHQGLNFRGSGGQQVLRPGGGHTNLGERHRPSQRPSAGNLGGRHHAATRPSSGGGRAHAATRNLGGHATNLGSRAGGGLGGRAGGLRAHGGGGFRGGGHRGGGGFRGGGHHGGGHRGGGRRSDIRLKHDIVYLGRLDDGLSFYRFSYNGSNKAYVGVVAQEVEQVMPSAVLRGRDGYLRVHYEKLGLKFQSYDRWLHAGAQIPATLRTAQ